MSGGAYSQDRVEAWIEAQIDEAWGEVDAETRQAEEKAWKGEVL